jgi:hypothetical protein
LKSGRKVIVSPFMVPMWHRRNEALSSWRASVPTVMLVSLKCCFSLLLRWFAKLLRALALILCHALLAAPLHQRWD